MDVPSCRPRVPEFYFLLANEPEEDEKERKRKIESRNRLRKRAQNEVMTQQSPLMRTHYFKRTPYWMRAGWRNRSVPPRTCTPAPGPFQGGRSPASGPSQGGCSQAIPRLRGAPYWMRAQWRNSGKCKCPFSQQHSHTRPLARRARSGRLEHGTCYSI